jgi:hypothetical protein
MSTRSITSRTLVDGILAVGSSMVSQLGISPGSAVQISARRCFVDLITIVRQRSEVKGGSAGRLPGMPVASLLHCRSREVAWPESVHDRPGIKLGNNHV